MSRDARVAFVRGAARGAERWQRAAAGVARALAALSGLVLQQSCVRLRRRVELCARIGAADRAHAPRAARADAPISPRRYHVETHLPTLSTLDVEELRREVTSAP